MKAAGIIRRIDDLGRIVIPKEIRQSLRINKGENIEIFLDESGKVILKKYSQLDRLTTLSKTITDTINIITKKNILITNTSKIIASSNQNQDYKNKELSEKLNEIITNRKKIINEKTDIIKDNTKTTIIPIIANSDTIGSIIVLEELTSTEIEIINSFNTFLTKYIEQ